MVHNLIVIKLTGLMHNKRTLRIMYYDESKLKFILYIFGLELKR